ncbi:hypothetical protein P1X15_19520 [Runella sp. MFBS21]|uniref:hypothetical protein n=1 Tax=Runella sp. MFBS21 TaxID=3034018 RepID=UPI0023F8B24A|nr:hypothetical protein [Runella sp. MFBS21]MDF7819820.1 hypothetical protein [Runella sp. MFBS21]
MKRRQFLSLVSIILILTLISCEKTLTSTPTIVTGRVIDENNTPVEGVEFRFSGYDQKNAFSHSETFYLTALTDKDGIYYLSQVIPNGTDNANILPLETSKFRFGMDYNIFLYKDAVATTLVGRPIEIQSKNYGKTNTFNFQIRKK